MIFGRVLRSLDRVCSRKLAQTAGKALRLGIRRETVNAWERRAPLAPHHVKRLTKNGVNVLIQPSNRRAIPIQDYIEAGAVVREDLSDAQLIISVKKVPNDQLIPEKTYAFFSHTIKAQTENMPMLDVILHRKIRLIDYERIVTSNGQRLVMFGKWAGYAGFINILHGLGLRLLSLGHHTPFLHFGLAHNYSELNMAINAVRSVGYEIALHKLPHSLGPLIFVFTGDGNVSRGAQELFQHLPYEYVDVQTLPKVAAKGQMNKVYGCVVHREDHLIPKSGGEFNHEEFDRNPQYFCSNFATEIAPYASVIINGIYWNPLAPRLITLPDAKYLLTPKLPRNASSGCPTLPHRLIAISDISADPGGSIEFMNQCTTIDKPFIIYDADFNTCTTSFNSPSGCLVCSVDNMPAQMPVEATHYFGDLLLPFIFDMLNCSTDQPFDQLKCCEEIKRAIITDNGKLTPAYEYIQQLRLEKSTPAHKSGTFSTSKRVVILGAGKVSDPLVHYFSKKNDVEVIVASDKSCDVERLRSHGTNIIPIVINAVKEEEALENLIMKSDLCISLLPNAFHSTVAKLCIKQNVNLVTSSYISPQMKALDEAAKEARITIMNEAGLDPGIDHMLAMECFDRAYEHGGKVKSFVSFCGGLPAPEFSDNALRYKFSWSPMGMFLAMMNPARYLESGKIVNIEGNCAVLDHLYPIDILPGFNLIGYANRDSTSYGEVYGIANECKTLIRGTLRYKGFDRAIKVLKQMGMLSTEPNQIFDSTVGPDLTWSQILASLMNCPVDTFQESLKKIVLEKIGKDKADIVDSFEEIGLFSDTLVERRGTALATLAEYLAEKLTLQPHERDVVILNHKIIVQYPGGLHEHHKINLVEYGEGNGGFSGMAKTVGYTCAVVSDMLLNGEIQRKGVIRPTTIDIYRPALKRLIDLGISATREIRTF